MEQKMAKLSLGVLVSALLFVLTLICLSTAAAFNLNQTKQQTHADAAVIVPDSRYDAVLTKSGIDFQAVVYDNLLQDYLSSPLIGLLNDVFSDLNILAADDVVRVTFGDGVTPLDIESRVITILQGTTYIFEGELIGNRGSTYNIILNQGTLYVVSGLFQNLGNGRTIANDATGALFITGGTVRTEVGVAVYNMSNGTINISQASPGNPTLITSVLDLINYGALYQAADATTTDTLITISGGTIENTNQADIKSGRALYNASIAGITITGGTVRMTGIGPAIYNAGSGVLNISEADPSMPTKIESYFNVTNYSTLYQSHVVGLTGTVISISGGTISNTGTTAATAIRNDSTGDVVITGGTVKSIGNGMAIHNTNSGRIFISEVNPNIPTMISGGKNSGTGAVIYQANVATAAATDILITMAGGTLENTAKTGARAIQNDSPGSILITNGLIDINSNLAAIYNTSLGNITVSGGTLRNAGTGAAINNSGTGIVNISQISENIPTLITSRATLGTIRQDVSSVTSTLITISGGIIENTGAGAAMQNGTPAGVVITGGIIRNEGTGYAALSEHVNSSLSIGNAMLYSKGSRATIDSYGALSITSGEVRNDSSGSAIAVRGSFTLSGGLIKSVAEGVGTIRMVANSNMLMTGGKVLSVVFNTITIADNAVVDIAGGTVEALTGRAIYKAGASLLTIRQLNPNVPTLLTSHSLNTAAGTVHQAGSGEGDAVGITLIMISGGTIENRAEGYALSNISNGDMVINGGTIRNTSSNGRTILNNGRGFVFVNGGTVSSQSGTAIYQGGNAALTSIKVSGGVVESTSADGTIYNNSSSVIEIAGGVVRATGVVGCAINNVSTGTIKITGSGAVNSEGGEAIRNGNAGHIVMDAGEVMSSAGYGIFNAFTGSITITGGEVRVTGVLMSAICNAGSGEIRISNAHIYSTNSSSEAETIVQLGEATGTLIYITDAVIENAGSVGVIDCGLVGILLNGTNVIQGNISAVSGKVALGSGFDAQANSYSIIITDNVYNGTIIVSNISTFASSFSLVNEGFELVREGNNLYAVCVISFVNSKGGALASVLATLSGNYPTLPIVSVTGYSFDGWFCGSTKVVDGAILVINNAGHTLVATWTLVTLSVVGVHDVERVFDSARSVADDLIIKADHPMFSGEQRDVSFAVYKFAYEAWIEFSAGLSGIVNVGDNGKYMIITIPFDYGLETIESVSIEFRVSIAPLNIAESDDEEAIVATIGVIGQQIYKGEALCPEVVVTYGDSVLVEGVHYVLTYENNGKAGVGTARVVFMGNYTGALIMNFRIVNDTNYLWIILLGVGILLTGAVSGLLFYIYQRKEKSQKKPKGYNR